MFRDVTKRYALAALLFLPGIALATTRQLAELETAQLTFGQSVVNQLSYDTYRSPFDELSTRPYNLLFTNIGRHSNLSPWPGQAGAYTRYFDGLIGNNGAANVDNDADAVSGSLIRRQTEAWAWGLAAAWLAGSDDSTDTSGATSFTDKDELFGIDLRGGAARQLSERRVLGFGARVIQAGHEISDRSFEQGVGGSFGKDDFQQLTLQLDAGIRNFIDAASSWEAQVAVGLGDSTQDVFSEDIDDTGAVTGRFVTTNYDIADLRLSAWGGYNRLRREKLGETEFRGGIEWSTRELDNSDLSFSDAGGVVTPNVTLLGQDAISTTRVVLSAKTIFPAGQTEMFAGAQLGYGMVSGATQVDAAGTIENEEIDDTTLQLGLTVGLRQAFLNDKLRFIISGRADLVDLSTETRFDTGSDGDDTTLSSAQYAIGLEGVLANVTFDIAWLFGEEAPVVPVGLGLPSGSRRTVELDRLLFSAGVSW